MLLQNGEDVLEERELFLIELVVIADEIVRSKQKTAGAARRVADSKWLSAFGRLRLHNIDNCTDERARSEVLTGATFHIFGVLLQKTLVSVAFHVGVERRPFFFVD